MKKGTTKEMYRHGKILKFEKVCGYCNYAWIAHKKEVKQCPRCKRYFIKNNTGEILK